MLGLLGMDGVLGMDGIDGGFMPVPPDIPDIGLIGGMMPELPGCGAGAGTGAPPGALLISVRIGR